MEHDEYVYPCNGCSKMMHYEEVAYTNNNGDDYCHDCYEAIQADPESAAGFNPDEV